MTARALTTLMLLSLTSLPTSTLASTNDSTASAGSAGPLVPGDWGFGFRTLASPMGLSAPEGHITYDGSVVGRKALSSRTSAGIQISFYGSYSEDQSSRNPLAEQPANQSKGNHTFQRVTIEAPFETFLKCRQQLCLAAQAGPLIEWSDYESYISRRIGPDAEPWGLDESYESSLGLGAEASLGIRWFFHPHLALASDYSVGITYSATENSMNQTASGSAAPDMIHAQGWSVSTRTMFAGVGLEAWF